MLKRREQEPFDLLAYFEGRTEATGVFEDRSGAPKRRFVVDLHGRLAGGKLILDEVFEFDDGEREDRTWTLTREGPVAFRGTCGEAVTEARGRFAARTAYLASDLRIRIGSRRVRLKFDDVFYDAGHGTVINRSRVSKWGITVGQVLIVFRKPVQRSP